MPRRSVAAFLYTALIGPLFGYLGVLASSFLRSPRIPTATDLYEVLLLSYYIGGIPAIVTGVVMAWLVRRRSWIRPETWLVATALVALVSLVFLPVIATATGGRSIGMAVLDVIAPFWIVAVLFASAGLRALLIAGKALSPPGKPDE
jgi:hypothetical protein